jgi:hypothetical protein
MGMVDRIFNHQNIRSIGRRAKSLTAGDRSNQG